MLDLPRAARLVVWGQALLAGDASPAQALRAVVRDDEPHEVYGFGDRGVVDLAGLFDALVGLPVVGLRLVLPVPGDLTGLTGPASFNAAALDAGECALLEGPTSWGLVPEVTEFGSALEPGAMVTWGATRVPPPRPPVSSLADAERALRGALADATAVLVALDVPAWRDDLAEQVVDIRDGAMSRDVLPGSARPRAARVMETAARVRAIASLAGQDDGGAVTSHEAQQRARVLRDVDTVARHALTDAVNAALEPAR